MSVLEDVLEVSVLHVKRIVSVLERGVCITKVCIGEVTLFERKCQH